MTYICRFVKILFRKNRNIEKLYLDYSDEYLFIDTYIILNYSFRNVIYYRFGNKITFEKKIKIFDLIKFEKKFDLTVYGFFRKKTYKLKFDPKLTFESSSFKTNFSNLINNFEIKTIPNLSNQTFAVKLVEIEIEQSKLKIAFNNLVMKYETFNQYDYL